MHHSMDKANTRMDRTETQYALDHFTQINIFHLTSSSKSQKIIKKKNSAKVIGTSALFRFRK